jgi:uncharacterized membrane protein
MKKFLKYQFGIIIWGLAFWLPIAILIFVFIFLFGNVEDFGRKLFLLFIPDALYHQGFGIALGIILIYLAGIILKAKTIRNQLSKIPILGILFVGGDVISVERLTHLTPCLFMMSPTCLSYGWILSEEKVDLNGNNAPFSIINVYYPNVPTLITGQVFPVRKDTVIKLANPSKDIFDLLLYSFRSPPSIQYLPWEGESTEDFIRRASAFGIHFIPSDWKY